MYTEKYYFDKENELFVSSVKMDEKIALFRVLKKLEDKIVDIIFANPPYFLSNDGITCSQ